MEAENVEVVKGAAKMLHVSAEILTIVERELATREVEPTPENIQAVITLISKSLPEITI